MLHFSRDFGSKSSDWENILTEIHCKLLRKDTITINTLKIFFSILGATSTLGQLIKLSMEY